MFCLYNEPRGMFLNKERFLMKKFSLLPILCAFLVSCASSSDLVSSDYVDDAARYKQNIALKEKGENFVVYEYKDVRVDELASLAIKYCEDNVPGTQAYLREIVLYRNHARRATFDCVNLAIEK